MDVLEAVERARSPAGCADGDRGQGADAPKEPVGDARIVQRRAHLSVHRQMDSEDYTEKNREQQKRRFHFDVLLLRHYTPTVSTGVSSLGRILTRVRKVIR